MNSKGLTAIVVVVGGLLIALYIIVSILSGFGNVIGATYKYFLPAAFLMGVLAPRSSIYVLILCGGYIDFFKKLMAVDYNLYFLDVFYILGVPPILLFGTCCGILAKVAQGRVPLDKRFIKLFLLAGAVVGGFALAAIMKTGPSIATIKDLSNTSSYYGLLFALPVLFPTIQDILKLLRFYVIIMIPAAIHGLAHFAFGLMPFEEEYLLSGLSMNLDYLLAGEGVYGPFASQGALAGSMTIAASLCAIPFVVSKQLLRGFGLPKRWICFLLILLFMSAAVFSLKRFPMVVLPFTVIGFFLIRSRFGTAFAYFGAISSTITLVALSDTLAKRLPDWQTRIDEVIDRQNSTNRYLFQLQTLNTRLEDFTHFKKPESWEPFGVEWFKKYDAGDYGVHSLLVKIFLRYGWVPLMFGLMGLVPIAWLIHRRLVRRIPTLQQQLFVFATSLSISMFLAASLGAAFFGAFPIPLFFAFFVSVAVNLGLIPLAEQEAAPVRRARQFEPVRRPVPRRA